MLKSYLKIAFRNLVKNPGYSFINIFGLALGITAFVLILLFITDELSYDSYHEESDRIYRVSREWKNPDGETSLHLGHVAPPFAELIREDYPDDVQYAVRFFDVSPLISYEEKHLIQDRFFFADADVFEVFSWNMIKGNSSTALSSPDGLVITESMAEVYFGDEDPIGKALEFSLQGTEMVFQVNGVIEDVPENSHFQFDFLASMQPVVQFYGGYEQMMQNFGSNNFSTYLLLSEHTKPEELEARFSALMDKIFPPDEADGDARASDFMKLHLMNVTDIHLHSYLDSEIEANGNIEYVYIYIAVAIFILLIACINFMNLSTARSARRSSEVGLRKVMGAQRSSLVRQFMGESFLLAFLALILGVIFVEVLTPYFNDFVEKDLALNYFSDIRWALGLLGVVAFIGLVAGSYPALFLSSFQPASVLKGSFQAGGKHQWFRSGLVVLQFTISIALIASMGIVYNQLEYVQEKELGFNKDNIAVLPVSPEIENNYVDIRNRLIQQPGIMDVSMQSRVPSGRLLDSQGGSAEINGELVEIDFRIADIHVSHNFVDLFGLDIVAGRSFDINLASDSSEAFVLNESSIYRLGYVSPEAAIGKQFNYGGRQGFITGVVNDFHFESLHQSIAPIVFVISNGRNNTIAVKFSDTYQEETIAYLENTWADYRPNFPFTYSLIEDNFAEQYQGEERLGKVFGYFALLAIIIAALGLFGLASFTIQQRVKEIGIRKVLGASVSQIVYLLSTNFAKLVLIAFLLATPTAYFAMNKWLENFAYSEGISPWIFIMGGGIALAIALLTISYQAIKSALLNPAHTLKSE
ncbi:MAG: ABC transporter permease [Balneolaceae bacterium]|nr:ABC transporter permease [Balneolaceae bacterium]MBO6544765.1 ABC transporter permease [Balneolaceae bacterium]MBO6646161.1 ABC transporter permease [Balneolaceae bacterium]